MANASSVFSDSVEAQVPQSIPGMLTAVDRSPRINHHGEICLTNGENAGSGDSTAQEGSVGSAAGQLWAAQPPTEPRSMRRKGTPPLIRRSDSYRPPERLSDRRLQHDLYRPSNRRYSNELGYESRASVSDCYRPSPARFGDGGQHDGRTRIEGNDHGHEEELSHSRPESGLKTRLSTTKHGRRPSKAAEGNPSRDPPRGTGKKSSNNLGDITTGEPQSLGNKGGAGSGARGRVGDDGNRGDIMDGIELLDDAHVVGGRRTRPVLAPAPVGVTSSIPPSDRTRIPLQAGSPVSRLQTSPVTSGYAVEKDTLVEPDSGVFLSPHRAMNGASGLHASNEDTASVPSTTISKLKATCRDCCRPGNLVTPLIPCSLCRRGFHDRCGDPKPSQR